ncbi:MAG: P-II family nitrogen regulator [Oscillospiraceae bacterium]|nr:P-II family nitrogen regulator [Oscillospiraceae bacterium]
MAGFELICCVVNFGVASKVSKVAKKHGIKGAVMFIGRGTVNNKLLDFLGIYEIRKEIVIMIIEKELAAEAIKGISEEMEFHKPQHGIAFSLSVSEFTGKKNIIDEINKINMNDINFITDIIEKSEKKLGINEVKDRMYKIIYVVVDKGQAEYVIDAANKAGARGGTIINGRGAGIHEVQKVFSIEIEPEKEEVFIITKTELKDNIVESIKTDLKIDEPGNGILFVMDVNEAYGLHEMR